MMRCNLEINRYDFIVIEGSWGIGEQLNPGLSDIRGIDTAGL
jgi:hypothetical protein